LTDATPSQPGFDGVSRTVLVMEASAGGPWSWHEPSSRLLSTDARNVVSYLAGCRRMSAPQRHLYLFLDEAGNLDFSRNGTRYFLLGCITKERPFRAYQELTELKYDLIEQGISLEYFHAAEDKQATRDRVFDIISRHLEGVCVDVLLVEKRKTTPSLQLEERFYAHMLGQLLQYILAQHRLQDFKEVIVFTDRLPVQRKRAAVEKAVKLTLAAQLPAGTRYRVLHHDSKSNFDLQIADYCTWAVYRKWSLADPRSFERIASVVQREWDFFQSETASYY